MISPTSVDRATSLLDGWLEGMRGQDGYGGPVVHWWRDSVLFCGAGLDWRYEGIIDGYLTLFRRTQRSVFLEKARRAGDDLVQGQLPDGRFRNSSFELNPAAGGTPHEAAADIGLLLLARTLRAVSDPTWQRYANAAKRNIDEVLIRGLWQQNTERFGDGGDWFVPNKAATIIEALCLLGELNGREADFARYVSPTANAIVQHQLVNSSDPLDGAIAQASCGTRLVERYFPFYTARAIPGLCAAYRMLGTERYLEAALRAARFVIRWREVDGGSPQVLYPGGRVNRYPRWIAGAGEVLRALDVLEPYGFVADPEPTLRWLLAGQIESGAIRAAEGFSSLVSQRRPGSTIELRDILPVVGWNDKAFRALAARVVNVVEAPVAIVELEVTWRGRSLSYREDAGSVSARVAGRATYSWRKGQAWATLGQGGRSIGG